MTNVSGFINPSYRSILCIINNNRYVHMCKLRIELIVILTL